MGWPEDLKEGTERFASGKFDEAWEFAARLAVSAEAMRNADSLRFVFRIALACDERDLARTAAQMLIQSDDEEDRFIGATWWYRMAIEEHSAGKTSEARRHLAKCLLVAPSHRDEFFNDPRIDELLNPLDRAKQPSEVDRIPVVREAVDATLAYNQTLQMARSYFNRGDANAAAEMLQTLDGPDAYYLQTLRLGLEIFASLEQNENAERVARLLYRGNSEDRAVAGKWFSDRAAFLSSMGYVSEVERLLLAVSKLSQAR